ncbi:Slam-dependent surface lipoprotein [Psychrobacter pygoscelis]|uniref:Slam-dependent surface lipoprotein n=1 Tax=Psychrobacter pygoscelis TaxID=2488563 RepID=UPI00103F425D|nr:Slam-dependent surface lipoprotein [Psychrobacter pygoscelis]
MNTVTKTLSLAVLGSLMAIGTAHAAGFAGASSDNDNILIRNTDPVTGPHDTNGNEPGIQVTAAEGPFGQALLSFETYQTLAGIDEVVSGYKVSTLNTSEMPPSHSSLGNFDFAQVPNQDVYFGEWTADRSNPSSTYTVYYGGKDKTTNLPSRGVAKYKVKGMNNYHTSRLMVGNLKANFRTNKIDGMLHDGVFQVFIDNNTINPSDASFSGNAKAYVVGRPLDNRGNSEGHFFGNRGKSLAGIATFNNRLLNTSFGGTRIDKAKDISNVISR